MDIYHYDRVSGELLGESVAGVEPLKGQPKIPAYATAKKPPTTAKNEATMFSGGAWSVVPDFRGTQGFDSNNELQIVTDINQLPSPEWTAEPTIKPLTNAEKIAAITASIQAVLDAEAQSRNYDSINAIGKYLGYNNAFRVECEALGAWTAAVWSKAYELLGTWQQTGVEITQQDVLAQLPIMGA